MLYVFLVKTFKIIEKDKIIIPTRQIKLIDFPNFVINLEFPFTFISGLKDKISMWLRISLKATIKYLLSLKIIKCLNLRCSMGF